MTTPVLRHLARYALACVVVGMAFFIALEWRQFEPHTYALFLFAVVATALIAGLGPALVATALALVAMNSIEYVFHGAFRTDLNDVVQLAVFVTMAVTVSLLTAQRQRAQSELARANAELRDLDHAKDRFIATVSHELRTPMTVILGWAALLRQAEDDELLETGMAAIEQSARAQARLIEDLLDMSRLILGKLHLEIGPVGLVPIVQQAVDMIRPAAEAKGVTVDVSIPRDPCVVDGDAMRLQQICWNLLSNAVKFTPSGRKIEVLLTRDEGSAEIIVSDTGEGIPAEFLPHIFEPLQQAAGATAKGGLGLGLAIVRQLVSKHNGTIEARSKGPGKGARFVVTLPLASSP
jgi:signal transduction histidine kinase